MNRDDLEVGRHIRAVWTPNPLRLTDGSNSYERFRVNYRKDYVSTCDVTLMNLDNNGVPILLVGLYDGDPRLDKLELDFYGGVCWGMRNETNIKAKSMGPHHGVCWMQPDEPALVMNRKTYTRVLGDAINCDVLSDPHFAYLNQIVFEQMSKAPNEYEYCGHLRVLDLAENDYSLHGFLPLFTWNDNGRLFVNTSPDKSMVFPLYIMVTVIEDNSLQDGIVRIVP